MHVYPRHLSRIDLFKACNYFGLSMQFVILHIYRLLLFLSDIFIPSEVMQSAVGGRHGQSICSAVELPVGIGGKASFHMHERHGTCSCSCFLECVGWLPYLLVDVGTLLVHDMKSIFLK